MVRGHICRGSESNWKHHSFNLPGMKDFLILGCWTCPLALHPWGFHRINVWDFSLASLSLLVWILPWRRSAALTASPWRLICSWTYLVISTVYALMGGMCRPGLSFSPPTTQREVRMSHVKGSGEMLHLAIMPNSRCCDAVVYSSVVRHSSMSWK